MSKTKKLHKQIAKKLDTLQELLGKIAEVQIINSDDKEALKLLEDQPIKGQSDELGQPLYEDGLCSLMDEYHSDDEENSEDF